MKIELFFDYACPFCYRGHKNLLQLLPDYPDLEIQWRPCEAHPRPEVRSIYSDLAIQGMYYIEEHGGDLWAYHLAVYEAMFEAKEDISDMTVLRACAKKSGTDVEGFAEAIETDQYAGQVLAGNTYAWEERGLSAVPSYSCGEHFIGSKNGILVSKRRLARFLSSLQ